MEYIIQCENDELAFYNVTFLNTQSEEDCQDTKGNNRCTNKNSDENIMIPVSHRCSVLPCCTCTVIIRYCSNAQEN